MSDRRKRECTTVEEIGQAKIGAIIDAIQVRDGDPSLKDVLRAVSAQLQERFGGAVSVADQAGGSTAEASEEAEVVGLPAERTGEEADDGEVAPEDGVEVNARLMSLVVNPIKAAYPDGVVVQGKKRTAEEIARAIPNVEAFLAEVDLRKQDGILLDFFELNEEGQLVMKDDCEKPYGLGENALEARIRQTRFVYEGEDGQTQVMTGKEYFEVTSRDEQGRPTEMKVSDAAQNIITTRTILMERGLPKLNFDEQQKTHSGEFHRMQSPYWTWTDDKTLVKDDGSPDFARARDAGWRDDIGSVYSSVYVSYVRDEDLGSRGVLRVNLNFKS